jgi:hypothetical protein
VLRYADCAATNEHLNLAQDFAHAPTPDPSPPLASFVGRKRARD